jgi:hypothetical protein
MPKWINPATHLWLKLLLLNIALLAKEILDNFLI